MPTVTYLGDDSNQASVTWCNSISLESFTFPINQPVDVDPESPNNVGRKKLAAHIVAKLKAINSPYFRLEYPQPAEPEQPISLPKIDLRTKEGRALKAAAEATEAPQEE